MAKEKICGIYCIENLINGKKYIGQSIDIYKRWKSHKSYLNNNCHYNKHLQNAWNKYEDSSFTFYILERCSDYDLNNKEVYWIHYFNSFSHGYNLTIGGDGTLGAICSEDKKHKISIANKGKKHTKEQRKRISIALLNSENVPRGKNHPLYGKKLSQSKIDKLRNGVINYYISNNYTPPWSKKVICVTTNEIFDTIKKACIKYDIKSPSNLSQCCEHNREFAGELKDGTRLQWEWYKENKQYIKKEQKKDQIKKNLLFNMI